MNVHCQMIWTQNNISWRASWITPKSILFCSMILTQSSDNILFCVFYLFASDPNHDVYFMCFFMSCLLNITERRQLLNIIDIIIIIISKLPDIIDLTLLGYYKRVMETLMLLYEHERLQQLYMYM